MKTLEELKEFYSTELLDDLQQLEAKRKQVMTNSLITVGVVAILALIVFAVVAAQGGGAVIGIFLLIGAAVVGGFICTAIGKGYKADFKRQIIRKIVTFLEPGLTYYPQNCIDRSTFKTSSLFTHHIDRYRGEDLVQGSIGQTQVAFSEIHAEYQTTTRDSKGRTQTQWHTIFKGLFFVADFNKDFKSQTLVLPDTAEKLFGGFGKMLQSWNVARADLIKLEDPEFEREFVVYGSDPIEARYILSTSLMRRIVDFKNKTGTKIYLSFTGSNVYVALPITQNLFEPKYMASITDFAPILNYARDLALPVSIVDDLNLNTRIWSKE